MLLRLCSVKKDNAILLTFYKDAFVNKRIVSVYMSHCTLPLSHSLLPATQHVLHY